MAVERQHDGAGALAGGEPAHVGDDGLVAQVHAVVGADRDHGALPGPRWLTDVGDDLHGPRRYPCTAAAHLIRTAVTSAARPRAARPRAWRGRRRTTRRRRAGVRPPRRAPTARHRRAPAGPGRWRRR